MTLGFSFIYVTHVAWHEREGERERERLLIGALGASLAQANNNYDAFTVCSQIKETKQIIIWERERERERERESEWDCGKQIPNDYLLEGTHLNLSSPSLVWQIKGMLWLIGLWDFTFNEQWGQTIGGKLAWSSFCRTELMKPQRITLKCAMYPCPCEGKIGLLVSAYSKWLPKPSGESRTALAL